MTKRQKPMRQAPELVLVKLLCAMVGSETISAGQTIEVTPSEAARLIGIGAAVAV